MEAKYTRYGQSTTTDSGQRSIWRRYRKAFLAVGLATLIGVWWLFRPERLFINQQVNESAPAAIDSAQPLFIGSLQAVAEGRKTTGRVSVLKSGARLQLEISNLQSDGTKSFTVALAPTADAAQQAKVLGNITIGGKETLAIPPGLDPVTNKKVLLIDDSATVIAEATLEPF